MLTNLLTQSRVVLTQPIFIWGAGRSGTYLLYDILSLHPDVACPRNNGYSRVNKGLWGSRHHGAHTLEALKGIHPPIEGIDRIWKRNGFSAPECRLTRADDASPIVRRRVRRAYQGLSRQWRWQQRRRLRLLDKSPHYLFSIDLLEDMFPDAFHVYCVRDPRSVVNSYLRRLRFPEKKKDRSAARKGYWGRLPPGAEAWLGRPAPEITSRQVEAMLRIGLENVERLGDRATLIHLERLLERPLEIAARTFERIALAPFPELASLLPDGFPDYSCPWIDGNGKLEGEYGQNRFFSDEELETLLTLERCASDLGYDWSRVGQVRVTSSLV